jgi:hypothetical protein
METERVAIEKIEKFRAEGIVSAATAQQSQRVPAKVTTMARVNWIWMGDPAEIKAKRVKKRKSFPQIWVPSPQNRDLRQLLWHQRIRKRHKKLAPLLIVRCVSKETVLKWGSVLALRSDADAIEKLSTCNSR